MKRSRVWRIGGATLIRKGGVVRMLMRGLNAVLHDLTSNSNDSISHLAGEPQIVMAHEAKGPTCEDMVTFMWEKLWICTDPYQHSQ